MPPWRARMPKVGLRRRNAQAKVCAAAIVALLAGETPAEPTLINILLQPGRARLRHLAERAPTGPVNGQSWPSRWRRGHQPARRAARRARGRGAITPTAGSARSPARCSDDAPRAAVASAFCCAPAAAAQALRPYEIVGDAIPESLTGTPGDPARGRAIVVNRGRALACCATPGRSRSERFQGDLSPEPDGRRRALVGRANCGCGWSTPRRLNPDTIMPSYYRVDGPDPRGARISRQADPDRRADRGRGGLSGDAERLSMTMSRLATRRTVLAAIAGAGRGAAVRAARRQRRRRWQPRSARWSAKPP